ncbi:very short patch repair endonuclease [Paraburkholderia azotifigens]|uniref:very short patch repair endonuclease n=1 Tax=Paraburkholderia azotifigens TaxID=2057004 RepID=UPI0038B766A7
MDRLTKVERSEAMRAVKSRNTKPEILVRRALHRLGMRFRLHRRDLPGSPDVVLPKYSLCIFVHGCFWHRHPGCPRASMPKTNEEFWARKFAGNIARDDANQKALSSLGWSVKVIWECEAVDERKLAEILKSLFSPTTNR